MARPAESYRAHRRNEARKNRTLAGWRAGQRRERGTVYNAIADRPEAWFENLAKFVANIRALRAARGVGRPVKKAA